MQVSVEQQEGLARTLRVEIPGEQVHDAVEQRLQKLQGEARLDGFRPGKVPLRVVRNRYGGQVRQEVMNELIRSTLPEAVEEVELQPAGSPEVATADDQPEEGGLAYTARFEVYPEVEIGDLASLAVERPSAEVEDADIDRMIETLQQQREQYAEVDRAAQQGDRAIIDFVGRIDGETFEGGSGQDTPVDLGSGRMVDTFEDQLEGIEAGANRNVDVTFPDDYATSELAGKEARFEVACKAVQAGEVPAVDAAFAREFGIESGSIDELRDGLRQNMERELKQALETRTKKQVMDALLAQNPVTVPDALTQEEVGRLREQMKQQLAQQGQQLGDAQLPDEVFREEAERRASLSLLLSELVQRNGIEADEESVRERVQEMASAYEDPQQVIQHYYENQQMLDGVRAMVVEDRLVDWVLDQAQVTEAPTSFDELMREQQG